MFLVPRISCHPHYETVRAALRQRSTSQQLMHVVGYCGDAQVPLLTQTMPVLQLLDQADLQDVGCCYGQDTRQLIVDGWQHKNLVALDLVPNYWYILFCKLSCTNTVPLHNDPLCLRFI